MPYTIVTKDGIKINNIPDNVPKDSPELKARVAQERARLSGSANPLDAAAEESSAVAKTSPNVDVGGVLDFVAGVPEVLGTMATGIVAEPAAGFAGMVGGLLPGEEGQSREFIEATREALTFKPQSRVGKFAAQKVGEALQPIAEPIGKLVQGAGDVAFEAAGPEAGAATVGLISVIPDILGLKIGTAAKKFVLDKIVKGSNVTQLYDELGNLLPEIKKAVEESGLNLKEIESIMPTVLPEEALASAAQDIGTAATKKIGAQKAAEGIGARVDAEPSILAAADELGLSDHILPSHASQNSVFVAVEQGLKSVPGSQLAAKEKVLIESLGRKADELIEEFGGTLQKSDLSDSFRETSRKLISDMEDAADKAYEGVKRAIDPAAVVDTKNILGEINKRAEELGGVEFLSAREKQLLKTLDPKTKPTYARLDQVRRDIGSAFKGKGPFKDADDASLKRLYGALAADQKAAAAANGAGDLYETASSLVSTRKGLENQLVNVLGKDLTGVITTKAKPAILNLQNGDTKAFDALAGSIPSELGKDMRKSVFVTALNDAFVQGSRAERSLNIAGFDDFMKGLNRNPSAKARLAKEIGTEAMQRLDTMHKVVGGVRKAQKEAITTGRIAAVPGLFDDNDGFVARLYGTAKKVAVAEGASQAMGMPGVGTAGVLGTLLNAKRVKRSIAADELLASPRFIDIVQKQAAGKLDTVAKIETAERALRALKQYQKWEKTLTQKNLADLAAVGILGYLSGKTINTAEESK